MSAPRVVGPRQLDEVLDALAEGRAVVVSGDGGYQLAVSHAHLGSLEILRAHGAPVADVGGQIVVGRRAEAAALTAPWSTQTSQLADRMWPGPLTLILPAPVDAPVARGSGDAPVWVTMPAVRPLRTLVRRSGPLAVLDLVGPDGASLVRAEEVLSRLIDGEDVAFVVDDGPCGGPPPTVVDCRQSSPRVRSVGALPESYVEAALLMAGRKRTWFRRRKADDTLS